MEKSNNEINEIKITLLEIKPSLKELEKNNNEISIIFQGINVFYNLRKLLSNKTEILINNCKNSVIISLVKSDNIFASALFNIKHGENWITFNYESKKKNSISSINNIDCIKIKIFCNQITKKKKKLLEKKNKSPINSNKYNKNSNTSKPKKRFHKNKEKSNEKKSNNNEIKNHSRYDSILTEINHHNRCKTSINVNRINSSTPLNKGTLRRVKNGDITKTRNDINKSNLANIRNSEFSLITFNHQRINTSSSYNFNNNINNNNISRLHSYRLYNKNKMKIKTQINIKNIDNFNKYLQGNIEFNNNYKTENNKMHINSKNISNFKSNYYSLNQSPIQIKYNSIKHKDISNNLFFGYNKYSKKREINNFNINKNKKTIKNRLFKSNIQGNVTNSYSTATTKKNEFEGSINSMPDYDERIKNKKINKKYRYPLTAQRHKKENLCKKNKSEIQMFDNNKNINKNSENLKASIIFENENKNNNFEDEDYQKYIEKMDNENNIDNYFFRLKSDFDLLYNDQYIYNIKDDLLNLEIELFVEKMMELISAYHKEIEFAINDNKISKNTFNENRKKYSSLFKLNNKLKIIKDKYEAKNINLNNNIKNIKQQKNNILLLNKEEFNLFDKLIYNKYNNLAKYNNLNIKRELKEILNIILNNDKNKKLLNDDKYTLFLGSKPFIRNNNSNQSNLKIRKKAIPKKQHTKLFSSINNNIQFNNNNQIYNTNHIYNNNHLRNEGIYIKKAPRSPLHSAREKYNDINFNI